MISKNTGQLMKLGKKPPKEDPRKNPKLLQLKKYLKKSAVLGGIPPVPAPDEVSWITKLAAAHALPMYLNDQLGCCVEAAAAHCVQQWTFYAGKYTELSDSDVLKAYEDVGGYVPGDPSTDNGTNMLDFMHYWVTTGIGGHKIQQFAVVDWQNDNEVRLAISLLGNVFTGIALPTSVQGKDEWIVPEGGIYSDAGAPGGWGGHCIPFCAKSPITGTNITWGTTLKASYNFMHDYIDEMYVALSPDWIMSNGLDPALVDIPRLREDLAEMGVVLAA